MADDDSSSCVAFRAASDDCKKQMILVKTAGKPSAGYDALGSILRWATFVGFISLVMSPR
jgi:hypothetical protein